MSFLLITFLRLIVGCCNCDNEFYNFDYSSLIINNIDNSGQWSKLTEQDEMEAASIAFKIQVTGSAVKTAQSHKKRRLAGFKTLSAQNCNCEDRYEPNQTISEIHIRTLFDLNSAYCCNDEVTSLFLANTCVDCADIGSFYITIDELLERINSEVLYDTPVNKFLIYLKEPVQNDEAQFEIEIVLSDEKTLVSQTNIISII